MYKYVYGQGLRVPLNLFPFVCNPHLNTGLRGEKNAQIKHTISNFLFSFPLSFEI